MAEFLEVNRKSKKNKRRHRLENEEPVKKKMRKVKTRLDGFRGRGAVRETWERKITRTHFFKKK